MKFRYIYYLSGNTGILAKDMGKAIVCQFPNASFREETMPLSGIRKMPLRPALKFSSDLGSGRPVIISTLLDKLTDQPDPAQYYDHN